MDEGTIVRERRARRRARSVLSRFSLARPARPIGSVRRSHIGAMDELFVHPERIIRMLLQRNDLTSISYSFLRATPWCREKQVLAPNRILRWQAETALLSSLGKGFGVSARVTAFLLRLESNKPLVDFAPAPAARTVANDLSARFKRRHHVGR